MFFVAGIVMGVNKLSTHKINYKIDCSSLTPWDSVKQLLKNDRVKCADMDILSIWVDQGKGKMLYT